VPWVLVTIVGLLMWAGTTLLLDAWMRRPRRPTLAERLALYQPRPVADEAEEWLRGR
jgi:hypothetical protein